MARGWESKSVESQIEDAAAASAGGAAFTAAQREAHRRRHGLDLARRRVLSDLAAASSPTRRAALEEALAFLDAEMAALGSDDDRQEP